MQRTSVKILCAIGMLAMPVPPASAQAAIQFPTTRSAYESALFCTAFSRYAPDQFDQTAITEATSTLSFRLALEPEQTIADVNAANARLAAQLQTQVDPQGPLSRQVKQCHQIDFAGLRIGTNVQDTEQVLRAFLAANPHSHPKWSRNRHGLGEYFEARNMPSNAVLAYYDSFAKAPSGRFAPDSLLSMGRLLIRLNKLPDACRTFREAQSLYGAKFTAEQRTAAASGLRNARCS